MVAPVTGMHEPLPHAGMPPSRLQICLHAPEVGLVAKHIAPLTQASAAAQAPPMAVVPAVLHNAPPVTG